MEKAAAAAHWRFPYAIKSYMMENSIYSVITPEGCASILWKDSSRAPEAAESLKLTAKSLKEYGLIDEVIKEPEGFSRDYMDAVCEFERKTVSYNEKAHEKYRIKNWFKGVRKDIWTWGEDGWSG